MKKAFLLGLVVGGFLLIPLAFGVVAGIVPIAIASLAMITAAPFYAKAKHPIWYFSAGLADTAIISLGVYMTLWQGASYIYGL